MKNILLVVGLFLCVLVVALVGTDQPQGRVYDCGMAEWHPDIPTAVREECRRRNYEEWKRQNAGKYRT